MTVRYSTAFIALIDCLARPLIDTRPRVVLRADRYKSMAVPIGKKTTICTGLALAWISTARDCPNVVGVSIAI
jgi:hypothetical protein